MRGAQGAVRASRAGRALVVAALGLLLLTWAVTTPSGGFPDELDHYVRGLSVGRGELVGDPERPLEERGPSGEVPHACCDIGNPSAVQWVAKGVRVVSIPAELAPAHLDCGAARHRVATCRDPFPDAGPSEHVTTMGTLEPAPYLAAGLATRLTSDPDLALLLARLANAAIALVLLALAVRAVWPGTADRPLALGGLLLATTPMVLFVGASPSPSGIEVVSGLAFAALLLRVVRGDDVHRSRRIWLALAFAGALLATSRSLGPVWIVADALVVGGLVGFGRSVATVREGGRWAGLAVGIVALAGLSTALWEAEHQPKVPFDLDWFVDQLHPSVLRLDDVGQEVIGRFGQVDIPLPLGATAAWTAALVVLASMALRWASWRLRAVAALVVVAAAGAAVLVTAGVVRQYGFDIQGRHVLAFAVTVPLVLGEIARGRDPVEPARRPPTGSATVAVPVLMAVVAAQVHLAGVVRAGAAYGWVGPGRPAGAWSPPGGGTFWLVVAAVASLALVAGVGMAAAGPWWGHRPGPSTSDGGEPGASAPSSTSA